MPNEEKETHPSWAMIQANRVSGQVSLFGSHVQHDHFVEFRVCPAKRGHDLGQDWYYSGAAPMIVFQMSSAQFAELITNMNVGPGVPCTLRSLNGVMVERPPVEASEGDRIKKEFKKHIGEADKKLDSDLETIQSILSKNTIGKADRSTLLSAVKNIVTHVRHSTKFYVDQFDESTERISQKAKTESSRATCFKL